jgi:hypothetical protein
MNYPKTEKAHVKLEINQTPSYEQLRWRGGSNEWIRCGAWETARPI